MLTIHEVKKNWQNANYNRVSNLKWSMKQLTLISISNKRSECL